MTEQPTVRVYSKPQCWACTQTKNLLKRRGVLFVEEDLTEPNNLAAAKANGHMSAPVVVYGSQEWSGFRPDLIDEIAERINETKENK